MAERRPQKLLRSGFDDLGLGAAMSDPLVPLLVAAMAFLAALAVGGVAASAALARHWQSDAQAALTVQVPQPGLPAAAPGEGTREARVVSVLRATPGVASARALGAAEVGDLLRPWLGDVSGTLMDALDLPGVVQVQVDGDGPDSAALAARLTAMAPGTLVESHDFWAGRLAALAHSLQACAALVLVVVAAAAAGIVGVAARSGLTARRQAIEIVHGLGASDGMLAARFAARATRLAALGAAVGMLAALPFLLGVAWLAAPLGGGLAWPAVLPVGLWFALAALPPAAAAIGWLTAQATVRHWLRRLP